MKNLIVASTSTIYGSGYLEYLEEVLVKHFKNTNEILFIPFARPSGISHDTYTEKAATFFHKINKKLVGIHTFENPIEAIKNAKGIFTGGGNTFLLVKKMHDLKLMAPLREMLLEGTPYLGTSAGSNLCGVTMQNTNDMPIVYPPSFKTLGVIPFNINAHFLDPSPTKHMGETRETRIKEYHTQNTVPVVGLREGSWLEVKGENITLKGHLSARVFEQAKEAYEVEKLTKLTF
ncbi:dipeptidase E [Patiriisocius marinistellae]|uniref:Dipeptidase E n=1 Tax=Patiriisocius marinistellae TaxID=2494560 RepID=A0A5J4G2V0_9FLAO|nr:dipeptidase PepE [Patiriisocius marinistellae]GEQ87096.1 dipeptidase E [Patiriisocius marinistellae]